MTNLILNLSFAPLRIRYQVMLVIFSATMVISLGLACILYLPIV